MQESLQASATGAPASYSELRFSPGIGKIYKRLHKRSKEGGRNWIGEGDWRMEAKEPRGRSVKRDFEMHLFVVLQNIPSCLFSN